jgi:DNA replication and repair protein RecF
VLTHLDISHFRNLTQLVFDIHPTCNLIVGPNGAGKSSVLEAIYFLSYGRSFRSGQMAHLIQYNQPGFQIVARRVETPQVIGLYKSKEETLLKLDGAYAKSHTEITRLLPVLYFNPERIQQFLTQSKKRRQFLDWGVFYHSPQFLGHWQHMSRLLKQRNAALKQKIDDRQIRLWDEQFAQVAQAIDEVRQAYLQGFMPHLRAVAGSVIDQLDIGIHYYRGWSKDKSLLDVLDETRGHDRQTGYTSHGPHRADLKLRVKRAAMQDVLSRGQQKIIICSLNIAAAEYFKEQHQIAPIVLVDDLASELDQHYCNLLIGKLFNCGSQVFLTSIQEENLVQYVDCPNIIRLKLGLNNDSRGANGV